MNYAAEALDRGWFPLGMSETAGMARMNFASQTVDAASNNIEAVEGLFTHISFAEMDYLTLKWLQFREDGSVDGLPEKAKLNFDLVQTAKDKDCKDCADKDEYLHARGYGPGINNPCISYYPGEGGNDFFEIVDPDGDIVQIPGYVAREYAKVIMATGNPG